MSDNWQLFQGNGQRQKNVTEILSNLDPPPWRQFGKKEDLNPYLAAINLRWEKIRELAKKRERDQLRGQNFRLYSRVEESQEIPEEIKDVINGVNAAIYLRRPLLITGNPGSGKSTLAYAIAYELNLGTVLSWAITARSTLQDGLYRYDAIARLQDTQQDVIKQKNAPEQTLETQPKEEKDIGQYITLGALGTAFLPSNLPRVLLIDEIDKSDINLPNDLLNLLEEGQFPIPELVRRASENSLDKKGFKLKTQDEGIDAEIQDGWVRCYAFPIIIMTSNGERDFPPAFKRRCLRIKMPDPNKEGLEAIVKAHFREEHFNAYSEVIDGLITEFLEEGGKTGQKMTNRSTDQLLNTIYVLTNALSPHVKDQESVKKLLLKRLSEND